MGTAERRKPDVFKYTDYRKFLRDAYEALKSKGTGVSYRSVCRDVGIKSAGHLSLILNGKANISEVLAHGFADYFGLTGRRKEYFLNLVSYNQSSEYGAKRDAFDQMMAFPEAAVRKVDKKHFKYYDKWYYSAVRLVLLLIDFKDDYRQLAAMLSPTISSREARRAVKLLQSLGMIKQDENGFFRPVDRHIDTGTKSYAMAINNYALSTLELAEYAFNNIPEEQRRVSWVTAAVTKKGYDRMVAEMREFRRKIHEISSEDGADRIYQVNVQIFPLSKPRENGARDE